MLPKALAPGDRVVVANSAPCGACPYCEAGRENLCERITYLSGAFAERLLVPAAIVARNAHRVPAEVPAERAALAEPLACALHAAARSGTEPGATVAVLGAGAQGALL